MNKDTKQQPRDWTMDDFDLPYEYINPLTEDIRMVLEKLSQKGRQNGNRYYSSLSRNGAQRLLPVNYAAPKRTGPTPNGFIHGVGK